MVAALQFPKLGSTVERTVDVPESEEGTADGYSITIKVKLVGALRARAWSLSFRSNQIAESRRIAKMKGTEDDPPEDLHGPTEEGIEAGQALAHDILTEALVAVEGVDAEGEELIREVEGLGLAEIILPVVISAQSPRPTQLLSVGS